MAAITKKGANYFLDYRVEGRRVIRKVGLDKKLAEKVLHKCLAEIAENKYLDIRRNSKIRFKDYIDWHLKTHSSGKKEAGRKLDEKIANKFNRIFGEKSLFEVTAEKINQYKNERKANGIAGITINRELAFLKTVFNKALEENKLQKNPMSNKKVMMFKVDHSRIRYLEPWEKERLLRACMRQANGVRKPLLIYQIITVLLNTGMRKGELQRLEWSDVNFEQNVINLRDTKNGESRHVQLNRDAREALLAVRLDPRRPDSSYVFCGKDGEPFNFRKSFETAVKNAGIKNFRIHDCRHHFASWLAMKGVDLNTVRDLLGHKSLTMTLRYSHLSPEHKGRAVALLCEKVERKWKDADFHRMTKAV